MMIGALPEVVEALRKYERFDIENAAENMAFFGKPRDFVKQEGRKAVIEIDGLITPTAGIYNWFYGGVGLDRIRAAIGAAVSDTNVEEIELLINSGGGFVEGVSETYSAIKAAADIKPVRATVKGTAASAAYWLASAADEIAVEDSSIVGSIGVASAYSKSSADDQINVVSRNAENKRPDPRTDEGRAEIQKSLNALEDVMIAQIAQGRRTSAERVRKEFGQGGLFVGDQAVRAGLADRLIVFNKKERKMEKETAQAQTVVSAEQLDAINAQMQGLMAEFAQMKSSKDSEEAGKAEALNRENARLAAIRDSVAYCDRKGTPITLEIFDRLVADVKITPAAITKETLDFLANRSETPQSHITAGRDSRRELVAKAIEHKMGVAEATDEAGKYANMPYLGLAAMLEGEDALAVVGARDLGFAQRMLANSEAQFPLLLATVVQKAVNQELELTGGTSYQSVATEMRMNTTSGKTASLDPFTGYLPKADIRNLNANEVFVGEKTQEYKLEAYTLSFSLTPTMLIDDQLKYFENGAELVRAYARMVKPTENKLIYDLLAQREDYANYTLGDGQPLFSAARGNLSTGSDAGAKTWYLSDSRLSRGLKYLHLSGQPAPRVERGYDMYKGLEFRTLHYLSAAYLGVPQLIYRFDDTALTAANLEAAFGQFALQKVNGLPANLFASTLIVPQSLFFTAEKLIKGEYSPTFVDDSRLTSVGKLRIIGDAELDK
ncbi:MAG: S49 family peptidase [Helicobacteraceae bacterium]|jgi:ClpP class serine protease|nr:S49 family peptidase [Helicobacteraceae bacterium]